MDRETIAARPPGFPAAIRLHDNPFYRAPSSPPGPRKPHETKGLAQVRVLRAKRSDATLAVVSAIRKHEIHEGRPNHIGVGRGRADRCLPNRSEVTVPS